ncbi:MAG: hypothetical protein PSV36_07485 [Algoriphagus sp.]|nr:hypothetical protein [Algoriphagus sp.]
MKKLCILVTCLLLLNWHEVSSQNYNKIMGKSVKKAIGTDLRGYQIFSYPTDNYGLITSFENSVLDANFICDTWNCIGINDPDKVNLNWLNINDFAAVGGGGTIELSEKKKSKVAVEAILPKIYNTVGVTGGFENDRKKEIVVTIGRAYLRKLRRSEILEYINSLENTKPIKQAFNNGTLVLVVGDCVIEDMSVTVKVDQETSIDLDAKLEISGSSVAQKVFKDASLSVGVEKISSGVYKFEVSHPIIFARLTKKQPAAGLLSDSEDFLDWELIKPLTDESKLK